MLQNPEGYVAVGLVIGGIVAALTGNKAFLGYIARREVVRNGSHQTLLRIEAAIKKNNQGQQRIEEQQSRLLEVEIPGILDAIQQMRRGGR